MSDVLRKIFDAIMSAIEYFASRSTAKKEAEQREEKARAAREKVGSMSDTTVRDELREYARTEEGGTDANKKH